MSASVYFAGHGLQMRGRSYLLPVGVRLDNETDVRSSARRMRPSWSSS
jgi:uncharacterized caspase-like protein